MELLHAIPNLPGETQRIVSETAGELTERIEVLADEVTTEIAHRIPELRGPETLRLSCRANILGKFLLLQNGFPTYVPVPETPREALLYASDLARQGKDVSDLLRAYRLGHGWFWRTWTGALAPKVQEPPLLAQLFEASAAFLFGWFDTVAARVSEEYQAERARWLSTAVAAKAETVRAILSGTLVDSAAASQALGYELGRTHLGLVLQAHATVAMGSTETLRRQERAVLSLAAQVGTREVLALPAGMTTLWAWIRCDPRSTPEEIERLARRVRWPQGVWVACGDPSDGLEGFRASHEEALETLRIAALSDRPAGRMVHYRAVAVPSLLSADLDRAQRFVERELGALAAEDDATARVRATVRIFLEEGCNQARTARRLGVHYNTVSYRIRRAEEMLGRPIAVRRFELEAALALAHSVGAADLEQRGT